MQGLNGKEMAELIMERFLHDSQQAQKLEEQP
jgi:hypothetical protein